MKSIANPAMVTLAREARGLSQTRLAKLAGVSQAQISKIEASIVEASPEVLETLGKALRFPVTFFYQTDPIMGAGTSEFFHRKRQSVPTGVLRQVHAQINIARIHTSRLLYAVDVPECAIPSLDIADFRGDASEAARAVRAAMGMSAGPILNMTQVIENAGGLVVSIEIGTPEIDAVSRWVPGMPPLFFINVTAPVDRYRMSLAHELGHMVLHRVPEEGMERQATEFAAEFLMPARDIKSQLYGINLRRLAVLKPYWRVAMSALLVRAKELKCITEPMSQYLWRQMSARGYRKREPAELDLTPETPTMVRELFDYYRNELGYTVENFSELFTISAEEVMSRYPVAMTKPETMRQFRRIK